MRNMQFPRLSFREIEIYLRMLKEIVITVIISFLIGIAGCNKYDEPKKINLDKRQSIQAEQPDDNVKHLRAAVGGMITPKEGLAYYKDFLDYIGEKLGEKVDFVDRESYAEINTLLEKGDIALAFVCSGPYVDGHNRFGLELLVSPQAYGDTVYYSYLIVHKDSPIRSFEELRNKKFAFTDPLSNTGKIVPTFMLAKMNETPETFFENYIFTKSHDRAIQSVGLKVVDGAAVDSLIWEYLNRTNPEFTAKTRIIKKSPPYGIPPVVVSPGLNPDLKKKLRQVFLDAHNDERGSEILKKMMIDKFVVLDDHAYDSVREMKVWLEKHHK